MGSEKHSFTQAKLAHLLANLNKFNVYNELSIEINGNEYKPDVCIYQKSKKKTLKDIIRMTEMPLLAIEILSPSQGFQELADKVEIYFNAGIKSNWIVLPSQESVIVCSSLEEFETFSKGNVIDNIIGIELPINEIFE